ncbi:unnamed protein product, partial [Sphacelaria rigidula]
ATALNKNLAASPSSSVDCGQYDVMHATIGCVLQKVFADDSFIFIFFRELACRSCCSCCCAYISTLLSRQQSIGLDCGLMHALPTQVSVTCAAEAAALCKPLHQTRNVLKTRF